MLSLNIASRGFVELSRPLSTNQAAPIVFLWIERLAILVAGVGEQTLRFFPLLTGLALLVVFRRLAERLLDSPGAVLALWCVALSPALIYYSNEVKPYGSDAFLATVLMLAILGVIRAPRAVQAWRRLDAVSAFAALASIASIFVLVASFGALAADRRIRADREGRRETLLALGSALALFAIAFFRSYTAAAEDDYLRLFWEPSFLTPFREGFFSHAWYAAGTVLEAPFVGSGGLWRDKASLVLIIPLGWGIRIMWRRWGGPVVVLLVGPMALALVASALRRYPFAPRLMLFWAPAATILVTAGLLDLPERLRHLTRWSARIFATPLVAIFLVLPALGDLRHLVSPDRPQDLAPLFRILEEGRRPGDAVYVFNRSVPAWAYYTTDWRHPDLDRVRLLETLVSSTGQAFRAAPSRGHRVFGEGDNLVFPYHGGTEIVGVPTGQGPTPTSRGQLSPDPGWEENEAERLRSAVGTGASGWVILSFYQDEVVGTLTAAIEARGGKLSGRWSAQDALLLRFSFNGGGDIADTR